MSSRVRRLLRQRAPALHRHASRAYAQGMWCWHRLLRRQDAADEYGDDFWQFHDTGDWSGFARLVLESFSPRIVVDVGCGDGKLLAAIAEVAPATQVTGYDGSSAALARARARGVPVEHVDLASLGDPSGTALARRLAACDLATCLETAEHLPPWSARPLVRTLGCAPLVMFSAAQPGQGGRFHLNERPLAFWRSLFEADGFERHPDEDDVRHRLERLHLPAWYAANLQVFRRP